MQLTKPLEKLVEIAETKRILSGIENNLPTSGPACLLVTSAARGEGKTLITAGLGVTAARLDSRRVLMVDLNWYKPALHECFGLEQAPADDGDVRQAALERRVISTGLTNLDLLTAPHPGRSAGPPGTTMPVPDAGFLANARERYDLVLIDTCALFPTNRHMVDPVVVARYVDGVVLVVLANVTRREEVRKACARLDTSGGGKVLGAVVNQWRNPMFG